MITSDTTIASSISVRLSVPIDSSINQARS